MDCTGEFSGGLLEQIRADEKTRARGVLIGTNLVNNQLYARKWGSAYSIHTNTKTKRECVCV